MNLNQFLAELAQRGIKLWLEGDTLRFRAPKGVMTSEDRDLLVLHKAKIISLLSQSNTSTNDTELTIVPVLEQREIPLSFPQEQLWFLSQLDPNNVSYNELFALRFLGVLNIVALEQSLNKIVARHAALRTNFATVDGQPVQVIAESLILTVPVIDLSNLPASDREIEVQRLTTEQAQKPFNLVSDPLIQATVLKLTDTEHIFLLRTHHIVWDGWSLGIMWRELAAFYNDLSQELPPLPAEYPDFAVWQKQYLTGEALDSLQTYWQQQLLDAPPLLELPTDRVRGVTQTFQGKHYRFVISKPLTEALIGLSRRQKVTLFMTLLAAFQTLLYRYTGQNDIVVGSPIANRDRSEFKDLIGYFVNTLVLRTCLAGNASFEDLLSRVRKVTLGAYAHRELPFEKLVEILQPERSLSHTPLFQVMFMLLDELPEIQMEGLRVSPLAVETGITHFDLALFIEKTSSGLIGEWEYNTDLFDDATIARMTGHFQTLLEGIVANPIQPISQLPLLTEAERQQLLIEWNNTTTDYPQDKCIHQLFEEQVALTPDAVAVVFEGEQLTYRELNARANQLAHYLQSLGVGAEVLVGICVERSFEMIVGLLGILKAGGAYVPIDPAYPTDRIAYMLDDSRLPVLLTQQKLVASLPKHQARVVSLDCDWQEISVMPELSPQSDVTPENLAYVIYTSGSTGKPKGVLIAHRGLCNLAQAQIKLFDVQPDSRVLQLATFSFDASIWEIVMALCSGARLCLGTLQSLQPGQPLVRLLQQHSITHLTLVPSALAALPNEELPALQNIIVAGEPCPTSLVAQWAKGRRFFNAYGPTESTICATVAQGFEGMDVLPIGRPIDNTLVYILDRHLQPVPIGVPGELHIASVGLARGYLNRPDLTAEKFIPNPFSNELGSHLYKTGDKARYLPDGNIEFLGRIDNQVKVRGFRIELGEIEAVLTQHPGVRETSVIARVNSAGDNQLVAYIVPHQERVPTISDLRRFLKEQLPEYMVPSAFVVLEALPLTPNGKVDRRALPAPDLPKELEESFVAPRTPIEEMLASIWGNILLIDSVGVHDNFFTLGGHSLLATQVISRVRDTISIELPLRSLFEAPTIAELAERVENSLKNGQSVQAQPLLPIPRSESIPLSFAQARLWFLDRLQPNSAFYNIPLALRLSGQLNIAALQSSINTIIQRHEALRTNFVTQEGQPVQVIASTKNLKLLVVDLLHLRESEREIEAQRLANEEANRPFNLEREPLLRGTVLQLGETDYVLLLTMHHIISDGWSLGVFVRELTELYKAFCTGAPPSLPELPVQYADFAVWQRQWLQGEILVPQLDYWKEQLLDAPALLELPTDRPRPAVQTFRGGYYYTALSLELSAELTALSKRAGVTLFMTLYAAFGTLLYRYSGQDDIVVGTPVANRNRREIEGLIGFFVNTLVLRTDLSGNPSFEQLLGRVKEVALGAYAHQDLPFEQLVEALQPTRDLSYTPLFQVMFALDDALVPAVELPELAVSSYPVEIGTAKFDLTLSMESTVDGLVGVWEYNTDLFDEVTIARMAGHFQTLLEALAANPIQPISQLPLLTQQERHQLLVEWNNTTTDYPQDKCIHQLFEEQVALTPDAVALIFEGEQLTYRELNARANQLAHYLQTLGVEPEVLVGICVERSFDMIVGILGILKAGGAYVPIDPAYPGERIAYMLDDSRLPVLLTQQKLVASLPEHQAQVTCLDSDWEEISKESEFSPLNSVSPENLAYVIYTSGSTGKPKGVTVPHRAVNRLVLDTNYINFQSKDVVAFASNFSFDAATFEIWGALLNGAKLVVITKDVALSPDEFAAQIHSQGITVLFLTTALFNLLAREVPSVFQSVRHLLFGGEVVEPSGVKEVLKKGSPQRLLHVYGPTENTTFTTWYLVEDVPEEATSIPIGRPIANTQVYLLDTQLQPVPIGVSGEIYIGGDGLARGYLNRPDLTDEKFIPNPFNDEPGSHLYKTGDLARYLPDGNIEFLGRIDNQVKIRGFRIELGEIEAVLTQHPGVRETAVIARENATGDKQLVAYLVPHQEPAPTNSDLRRFLKEQLPEYMVPNTFVTLESLPLTPNGKVDRRALPEPELRPELSLTFVAPRTPIEEMLANIWACVLGIEQVGVHDNFFELGGHSLLAAQIISRVRDTMSVELPLRSLFEAPTVASLAEHVENSLHSGQSIQAQPLLPIPRSGNIPLSFAQARLWFLDQLQPNSAFYNIPIALRLSGQLNIAAIESSLNEIICRHEVLRTNFTKVSGQPVQVIASTLKLKLLQVDLQNLPFCEREVEVQRLATTEAQRPFDLEREPLVRAKLLQLDETEYVFLLTVHHIIFDGWSTGVFYGELAALYEAKCNGKPKLLPELSVQYADFAVWQRYWLTPELLETQLNYWKQQLLGAPALLELPTDRPRKVVQSYRGAYQSFTLSLELSQALAELSKRAGVTRFMTLYAAFVTLLYRYTGSSDIVVGTPVANRNRQEIEGLIGFFVNTLALRTDLSANPSFEQLLRRVREVAIGAYAHQDLPFEQLVEALQPERSLSYTPLFQVMFALDEKSVPSMKLPDLTVNEFSFETETTKFDLTLSMENTVDGLVGGWEYNSDLFDAATIARMAGHFQTLLEAIAANPIQPISELPLLTQRERHQLLIEWNNTTTDYPQDKCIHQLFEEQVALTPDAVALVFEGEQLTYRELNRRANKLAHYLQSLGVGPEVLVGICVERSFDMIIGLLGVLKAGGAYVSIDPAYPPERIAYMLDDSRLPVLLTQQKLVASLPEHQARVVCLDCDWEEISVMPELPPQSDVTPENLAYVIYTSGSTGKPKGVLIPHSGLLNLIGWHQRAFKVTSLDRATQLAGTAFDASVWELWPYLAAGASIYLVEPEILLSPEKLRDWLLAKDITITFVPTPLAEKLLSVQWSKDIALRIMLTGGDKLHQYPSASIPFKVVNNYGPTENTVVTTSGLVVCDSTDNTSPHIGRPIDNTLLYILDRYLQPVPIGVPGELHIASIGLARGYLNRPDLTEEKFIPNPFSNEPGSRLYKTGDKARYLPDGNIEFLGRIDNQVKIRGFRIELGEVEAAITQHPAVRETVVVAREDTPGNKRLVAYVVPKGEAVQETVPPTINELRSFLKNKLPDYMVPGAFVFLETMPLTPNGKIDRRTLPAPDSSLRELENNFVAPSTPTEETLAAIWAEVLGLQQVGIHDNFFELGGHSLLATSVISRIQEAFKIELPLRHLFEAPTIASLSQVIETVRQAGFIEQFSSSMTQDVLPPLVPTARDTHIPLSFAQEYIWYVQQLNPDSCICNSGVPLRFNGSLSPEVLEKSINEIIRRHEILRTTFTVKEGQPMQVIAPSLTLPLKIVDLQDLPVAEREACAQRLVAEEFQHHFDLANGPLIKTTLLRLARLEHWLLIPMHHIITDGWSIGIFLQELETLYNAFSNGLPSPLPEVPLQYADFALWEQKRLNEQVLDKQLSYWLQKLADSPQPQNVLPSQQLQPTTNSRQASFFSLVLPESLVASISALSRTHGVTTFAIIITALKILLFKWSGQTEILVVATTGNRSTPEIERILGCFINDVILRSLLADSQTGLTLLEQVKETVNEAINHKEVPLQKVIEAVRSKRELTLRASVTMEPPVQGLDGMSEWEFIPDSPKCELWDEEIPLELYVSSPTEDSQTIEIALFYSTELFTNETIERLFSYYQEILQKLVEYPETKVSEF